jgi:hypothetical protein
MLVALAFLCGACGVHAQQWPGYPYAQPNLGYTPTYQPGAGPYYMQAVPQPVLMPPSPPADPGPAQAAPATGGGGAPANGGLWWASAGYTLSWFRQDRLPGPVLTTGSIMDDRPGALGQPHTSVLLDNHLTYDNLSGFQLQGGLYLDDDRTWSIEGVGFYISPGRTHFAAASDTAGTPLLTRPILNVISEQESSVIDAFPGIAAGGIRVDSRSELYGFEVNGRWLGGDMGRLRADALGGFRFLHLRENFTIHDNVTPLVPGSLTFNAGPVNPPNSLEDMDSFSTTNVFYGGQIGGRLSWEDTWGYVRMFGKLGLGLTTERSLIEGTSTLITPGAPPTVTPGGVLALPSNIGLRNRTVFGIVPEWGVNVGVSITDYLRVSAGYSFLLWNRVVRPGDLIDRGLNPGQIPTAPAFGGALDPARPEFRFNDSPFWVHTLNCAVEVYF